MDKMTMIHRVLPQAILCIYTYGVEDRGTYIYIYTHYEYYIASYKLSAAIMLMIIIKIITPHTK